MSEEFSFQEIEEILESILNNKKLVTVSSMSGEKFLVFSSPSSDEILTSRFVRERTLLEAIKAELPSREEIESVIEERGLDRKEREKIVELEDKLEAQRRLLNLTKIEGRRISIKETMDTLSSEINMLKIKSESLYSLTQEFRADEESLLFLAWASTYDIEGNKYWDSFKSFESDTDLIFRNSLIEKYSLFNRGLPLSTIRLLARHVLWRIRYTAALKIGGPLFTRGLHDLTPDQQALLYWSNYYQSIFEMLPDDQPSDDVIQDDEALDSYMEAYFKQREMERSDGRLKRGSGGTGKLSTNSSAEVIVTANSSEFLSTSYSEERVKGSEGVADVEVISPSSRRARNRRAARRDNANRR